MRAAGYGAAKLYGASLLINMCAMRALALDNGVGRLPPMGYSNWYDTKCDVHAERFLEVADALAQLGFDKLGYSYINIDAGGFIGRDANNNRLVPDPRFFPRSDMRALADQIHAKGYSFGLYTDRGATQCGPSPGSLGFESLDADTYANWTVDYLKSDDCNATLDADAGLADFAKMGEALNKTGRPIFYCICGCKGRLGWNWPNETCPARGASIANSWRIYSDDYTWDNVLANANTNALLGNFAGPGGWNDPDMLIGTPMVPGGAPTEAQCPNWREWAAARHRNCKTLKGCPLFPPYSISAAQSRIQFSLWSIMAAPLILSLDVRNLSPFDVATFGNAEVIDVDQDPLGVQGVRVVGGNLSAKVLPSPVPPPAPPVPPCVNYTVKENFNCVRAQCYACDSGPTRCCLNATHHNEYNPNVTLLEKHVPTLDDCARICYWHGSHYDGGATDGVRCRSFTWNSLNFDCYARLNEEWDPSTPFYHNSPDISSGHFANFATSPIAEPVAAPTTTTTNVWGRRLANGSFALLFVNVGKEAAPSLTCDRACFAALQVTNDSRMYRVRDLWAHGDLPQHPGIANFTVGHLEPESVRMYRFRPV